MTNEQLYVLLKSLHRQLEVAMEAVIDALPTARVVVTVDEQVKAGSLVPRGLLRDLEHFPALSPLEDVITQLAESIDALKPAGKV